MKFSIKDEFNRICKRYEKLLQQKGNPFFFTQQFLEEANHLLKEIRDAGSFIEDNNKRNLLESYAGHLGLFIFQETSDFPDTKLSKFIKTEDKKTNIQDWEFEVENKECFYGREEELTTLKKWILEDQCRLVGIFGIGGIGKTTLAVKLQKEIQSEFDFVMWRSLRTAPYIEDFLKNIIKDLIDATDKQEKFSSQELYGLDIQNIQSLIEGLISFFKKHRCLFLLDNLETILQSKQIQNELIKNIIVGYQEKYQHYEDLLKQVGQSDHQSCLLLTSREKPKGFAELEKSKSTLVHSCELKGLPKEESLKILSLKGLLNDPTSINVGKKLVKSYHGNPLALELVATEILDKYKGNIVDFLKKDTLIIGDIYDLLDSQFNRLLELEQAVMYWLAIEQKPIILKDLKDNFLQENLRELVQESTLSLKRRSLIYECEKKLRLQSVISEYVIQKFIDQIVQEINTGNINLFNTHALLKAETEENIRQIQLRLIINPVLDRLREILGDDQGIQKRLQQILLKLRNNSYDELEYVAGNILNLLCQLNFNLKDFDFSNLVIRQAYLQDVSLPHANFANAKFDVNFTNAKFDKSVFIETFGNVVSVAFSPDSQLLAIGDTSNDIHLWQVKDSTKLFTYKEHIGFVSSVVFSPNDQMLASGGEDKTVKLWDVRTGECLKTLEGHTDFVRSVAFSSDGQILASGSDDQTIKLWDVHTGECLKTLKEHTDFVRSVAFSRDGQRLASGSDDKSIRIWDVNTGECLKILEGQEGHIKEIWSVAFSPKDEKILASGSDDQTIKLWDVHTGECLKMLEGHTRGVWSVAFSPDGEMLASGSDDQTVRLWNVSTGKHFKKFQEHSSRVCSVAFSPDGEILASGSDDQTVRLWNVHTGEYLKKWRGYTNWIWSIAFSPNGEILASGNDDQTVRLWNISTGECFQILEEHARGVWSVAFSPDGQTLASGSGDRTVKLWDMATGECFNTLKGHDMSIWSIAFSPDGQTLASGSGDRTVKLWHVATGECIKLLEEHTDFVRSVAFSPDGRILASGSDLKVWLWDIDTGDCINKLEGHTDFIRSVAFSPDGRILASSGIDKTVRLWDVHTGKCIGIFEGHKGHKNWVWSIAFSPDGKILASGSVDKTVRLWDVYTGECLEILDEHTEGIWSVIFSPNGKILASAGQDNVIRLWDRETYKSLKTLKSFRPYESMNIKGVAGLTDAQKTTLKALGAVGWND